MAAQASKRIKLRTALIYLARCEIAAEQGLIAALRDDTFGKVGISVFAEGPLPVKHPTHVLDTRVNTPQTGGGSADNLRHMGRHVLANIERAAKCEALCDKDVIMPVRRDGIKSGRFSGSRRGGALPAAAAAAP